MDLNLLLNDLTVLLPAAVRLQRLAVAVRAEFQCDAVVILAMEPGGSSVNVLRALVKSELDKWGKVIKDSGAKAE